MVNLSKRDLTVVIESKDRLVLGSLFCIWFQCPSCHLQYFWLLPVILREIVLPKLPDVFIDLFQIIFLEPVKLPELNQ